MNRCVYIAGPLTTGDTIANVRAAIDAAAQLMDAGFHPFVPHLSVLTELVHPMPYERWLEADFAWILKCGSLLRLNGPSKGADREVEFAKGKSIPVFYSVSELIAAMKEES
jgi:nucleoside 2-deoxyribosyltransferase